MKDIGDWLYFLIIIVAGISSYISSIRKKQQQTAKQQRNQTPPVMTQKRQPTMQPQRPQQPEPQSRSMQQTISEKVRKAVSRKPSIPTIHINNTKNGINIRPEKEGISAITAEEAAFLAPTNLHEEKAVFTIEDMPSNIEEWRNAFIYKEIFQRKY